MRILALSYDIPRPDQSSGELRFFTLLSLLAGQHELHFYSKAQQVTRDRDAAAGSLKRLGIFVEGGKFERLLRRTKFEVVFFEFYFVAEDLLDLVRAWQPSARIVVDSVDVHFHRLRSKARLTGLSADHDSAETVRKCEVNVYSRADLVLTVSEDDSQILRGEGVKSDVVVIPNIHEMHPLVSHVRSDRLELIFVGSYKWAPNIDAVQYFCHEILPILRKMVPRLRLRIVGSSPTDEVNALAAQDIEIVGFVPEITSYLLSSDISIAPLRFGGGIKGKIGEAQAHGLPVVTTSIGAEGFGFQVGTDVLVGDTPQAFANSIASLWQDIDLNDNIRKNGWEYINERYSVTAVAQLIPSIFQRLSTCLPNRISHIERMKILVRNYLKEYVLWRF